MTTMNDTHVRMELADRRQHLARAARLAGTDIQDLIADVDAALGRLDHGTYGICDVCAEFIGAGHLERDPVARCCEEHPTPTEEARVNMLFHDNGTPASYATLVAASLLPGGVVDLYSAGHWPPILHRGGRIAPLAVEAGLPLGLFAESCYTPTRIQLDPADTLLFYTDGAIDAENHAGEDYNSTRLGRAMAAAGSSGLDSLLDRCLGDVKAFRGGARPTDDLMLLALRAA